MFTVILSGILAIPGVSAGIAAIVTAAAAAVVRRIEKDKLRKEGKLKDDASSGMSN